MNNNKKIFWAVVIALVMIIPVITIGANADGSLSPMDPGSIKRKDPGGMNNNGFGTPVTWEYVIQWQQTLSQGSGTIGEAGRIATDGTNFYVCGMDNNGDSVVLKYAPDGTLLWDVNPTSLSQPEDLAQELNYYVDGKGQDQQEYSQDQLEMSRMILNESILNDICYDETTNTVIATGSAVVFGEPVFFVIKHDADTGEKLWDRVYTFLDTMVGGIPIGGAVTVDDNGEIYACGAVITVVTIDIMGIPYELITSTVGLTLNLGENSIRHWVAIDGRLLEKDFVVYTGVELNSLGRLYFTGYIYKNILNAYFSLLATEVEPESGDVMNSIVRNNRMVSYHMILDKSDDSIYAIGGIFDTAMIVKFDTSLNVLSEIFVSGDFFQDMAIKGQYFVLAGKVSGGYKVSLLNRTDLNKVVSFRVGSVCHSGNWYPSTASGIVVDDNGDIALSGGFGGIDTIKFNIFDSHGQHAKT